MTANCLDVHNGVRNDKPHEGVVARRRTVVVVFGRNPWNCRDRTYRGNTGGQRGIVRRRAVLYALTRVDTVVSPQRNRTLGGMSPEASLTPGGRTCGRVPAPQKRGQDGSQYGQDETQPAPVRITAAASHEISVSARNAPKCSSRMLGSDRSIRLVA